MLLPVFRCCRSRQQAKSLTKEAHLYRKWRSPMHQYFLPKFKIETEMERKKAIQTLSNRRRDKVKGWLAMQEREESRSRKIQTEVDTYCMP